jgi:putative endonuclease
VWPFGRRAKASTGQRGEQLASRYLRRQGMKVLARNYRCPAGEADLIVLDRSTRREMKAETIAIVEVKTRSSDRYTPPHSAVDSDKRRRLRAIANYYLATHPAEGFLLRFDVVSVVLAPDEQPRIEYLPDAFS